MPAILEDRLVVIPGVSWEAYVQMDELLQDAPVRMKWCEEELEILSPISRRHEHIKSNLGRMVELFCRRRGVFFKIEGSATLRKERLRGGEPDESYIFTRGRDRAELVIETALSSGGIDKLEFYHPLEIPEVWIWQDDRLRAYARGEAAYAELSESRLLPGFDLALAERLADSPYTSEVLDAFERALLEAEKAR